jgi:ribonuclease E
MPNKMLIDATHPEETRVVVLRGNRVEEFDFESATRKQLRGNIYLAKVTRVEPSLQAAFVDYGGNRHGFLAFSEIHPDYYQIPVADRQALIEEDERAARAADDEADHRAGRRRGNHRGAQRHQETVRSEPVEGAPADDMQAAGDPVTDIFRGEAPSDIQPDAEPSETPSTPEHLASADLIPQEPIGMIQQAESEEASETSRDETTADSSQHEDLGAAELTPEEPIGMIQQAESSEHAESGDEHGGAPSSGDDAGHAGEEVEHEEAPVESVGGADALEEVPERMPRGRRQYKIQEVIKRRQVMLVQVVKEERGTKGAALTTYLSLAGRYSVLMPNTARGGGISRKITDSTDRKRLKEIAQELEVPEGMGVILRTAGASRTKTEVKRDFEYLLRMWETVRDLTLKSTAPKLTYEEGSLVKRSIRDLYNKEIDEVIVSGEEAFKDAKDFMRMLMPSHAKNVKLYKDPQPLFTRYGIESQLDAMFSPTVQLRSGGYIVINQAEALVAIDVNSGRATREHHIEDTALKTNLESAEEVARQLRMRDLAGLIVIDFIDMEEKRNNRAVERKLKECLKHDRARIQVGGISHFGLLEMSRQRIRTSVLESSTEKCPTCGGSGHVRSVASVALQLLRALEETLIKSATHNLIVRTRAEVAIYVLNHKRAHLRSLEERFRVTLTITTDPSITGQVSFAVDRGEQVHTVEAARALLASQPVPLIPVDEEEEDDVEFEEEEEEEADGDSAIAAETSEPRAESPREEDGSPRRKRRRRRGRRGGGEPREQRESPAVEPHQAAMQAHDDEGGEDDVAGETSPEQGATEHGAQDGDNGRPPRDGEPRRRRRGRRGGRRNRRDREGNGEQRGDQESGVRQPYVLDSDIAESTPTPRIEPVEVGQELGPLGGGDQAGRPMEPIAQPVPHIEPELPKRRSTVREPAPSFASGQGFTPAPRHEPTSAPASEQPASSSEESSGDEGKPRKTGWWAKRMFGDKG